LEAATDGLLVGLTAVALAVVEATALFGLLTGAAFPAERAEPGVSFADGALVDEAFAGGAFAGMLFVGCALPEGPLLEDALVVGTWADAATFIDLADTALATGFAGDADFFTVPLGAPAASLLRPESCFVSCVFPRAGCDTRAVEAAFKLFAFPEAAAPFTAFAPVVACERFTFVNAATNSSFESFVGDAIPNRRASSVKSVRD
jgi:hypothetical protein